ncbi:MAG TPA: hypothetical protein VGU46_03990 [Acidobacteriaceae bacterium]|nr:hypothetical protein [Acidobacteriaceae bacterium]
MSTGSSPLSGLPDFGAPLAVPGQSACAFAPYLGGAYAALPLGLRVAANADGTPRMSLVLVKSSGDLSAAGEYAVFDFTLGGTFDLESALSVARGGDSNATAAPILISDGFTRLVATNSAVVVSDELLKPVPIGGSGSEYARWTARLSSAAGDLVKGALESSTLLLGAQVEYQFAGVAPRVPCTASFKASALLELIASGRPDRRIASSELASTMQQAVRQGVVSLQQSAAAEPYEALADWVGMNFAAFVPALAAGGSAALLLNDTATVSGDLVMWDLSKPCKVFRQAVMTLDQIGGFSPAMASSIVREVTVPKMPLGQWSIDVTANLPAHRAAVGEVGVSVEIAANPPWRPVSVNQQLALVEPEDSANFQLQLSPREALSYTAVPYAVLAGVGAQVQNYTGAVSQHADTWIRLSMEDFPVAFAHISATPALLALADITLQFSYTLANGRLQQQLVLSGEVGDIAFPFPNVASAKSIELSAAGLQGGATLSLGPFSPGRIALDLPSFREYGPHRIDLSVDEAPAEPLLIELIAEAHLSDASITPGTVFFSEGQLTAQWGYVAASPFACGYCYRVASTTELAGTMNGASRSTIDTVAGSSSSSTSTPNMAAATDTAKEWSPVQSPFQPLLLRADGSQISNDASTFSAKPVQ